MPQYFDPMQSMNALASGAQMGGAIRSQQTSNALAPLVAKGDYKGAMDYAGSRGDLGQVEAMKTQYEAQLATMSEQDKQAAAQRAETLARTAAGLQGVPYEQRKAMLMQNMPILQEMGMDPAMIQNFDPTDEGIGQVLAQVTPLTELLSRANPEGKVVNDRLVNPYNAEVMGDFSDDEGPMSPEGKLAADLAAGRISQEQYQMGVARMTKPGTTVNVGGNSAPNPYANFPDGTMIEPPAGTANLTGGQYWTVKNGQPTIANAEGGAAQNAIEEEERKRLGRTDSTRRAGRTVVREAERARGLMPKIIGWGDDNTQTEGGNTTGGQEILNANARAYMAANVRGSAEYQFMENIEGALSNVGLDVLQNMRDNSPTGGALGQVPIQQQQRLEQVLGSFKITMPKPTIEENLNYLTNAYLDVMYGSKRERDLLVSQGLLSARDNEEIQSAYHDLNYDQFGRYTPPPKEAIQELMSNPTPQEMAEFNQTFGPGAAEAIVNGER